MKLIIQCSATKDEQAGSFSVDGRRVKFVAHPEDCREALQDTSFRPDDLIPSTSTTWRDHLLAYNRRGGNPDHLLPASDLYSPKIYKLLLNQVGPENLFILSAGWGLVRSGFLLPDYDITFSSHAEAWKRRTQQDRFEDFAQIRQSEIEDKETIYYFGGKDYLPLYYALTRSLNARKVVYFASANIIRESGFEYIRYGTPGTNWHYRCAQNFINQTIRR